MEKLTVEEIIETLRIALQNREEIIFAYLYGSFAEGLPFRDIDIAVYVKEEVVSRDEAFNYGLELSSLVEAETKIGPLDIRVINYAPAGLKYYVTRGRMLFSKDEEKRYDFIEETWKRYFDLMPKRKQILLDLLSP